MTHYIVSRYLDREDKPREIIDEATNKEVAELYAQRYREAFGPSFVLTVLTNPPKSLLNEWEAI